jgi:hypothetical protein
MNRAAQSSCCFGVGMHLHAWMEFCRHLDWISEMSLPFPLRRSDVGGEASETRLESECYSWPGKSHLGDWANNDASAVHRHPLEMIVIQRRLCAVLVTQSLP